MLSSIAILLPHPFQNIAMYFSLEDQQPQQQLTFKTLETVSQAYSPSKTIILSYLPSRNCHKCFFGSLHNPSNSGSHVFPIIYLLMTLCSWNVLEHFLTFVELAGSVNFRKIFLQNISELKDTYIVAFIAKLLHCIFSKLNDVNCSTPVYNISHAIFSLW